MSGGPAREWIVVCDQGWLLGASRNTDLDGVRHLERPRQ